MNRSLQLISFCSAVLLSSAFPPPLSAQTFSDWTPPVNLGATINSSVSDV